MYLSCCVDQCDLLIRQRLKRCVSKGGNKTWKLILKRSERNTPMSC